MMESTVHNDIVKDMLCWVQEHANRMVNAYMRQYWTAKEQRLQDRLTELRLPALGAYADLFTSRAAHELANLLVPVIAQHVEFRFHYHYAGWAMAMRDLRLIRSDRRNGLQILRFVNKNFLKGDDQIADQNLLTEVINKNAYHKVKDVYHLCLSIINGVVQRDLVSMDFPSEFCKVHPLMPKMEDSYWHRILRMAA